VAAFEHAFAGFQLFAQYCLSQPSFVFGQLLVDPSLAPLPGHDVFLVARRK